MEYNNTYNQNGQNHAQYAQSARTQNGKEGYETSKTKANTAPVFTFSLYEPLMGEPVLPDLLHAGCSALKTPRQRDMFLVSALAILSGCFNNVRGLYDGKMQNANMYCFLIAPPASDKSVMNWAKELGMGIHSRLIAENEAENKSYRTELAIYKSSAKEPNNLQFPPVEPKTKLLYIPANSSSAAIMRHIQQNNGAGIICETEADTLTNTLKQDWGNFDDLLRKAFHQEMFSYSRKATNEFVEVAHPKVAVALSGTPGQASRLLVSNENGLVSRFLFYISDTHPEWRDVSPKGSIDLGTIYKKLSEQVYDLYCAFKDRIVEFHFTDEQWKRHREMFKSMLDTTATNMSSAVLRLGVIAFKMAMVLTILRSDGKVAEDGKLICDDNDWRIAMHIAKYCKQHAEIVHNSLLAPGDRNIDGMKMQFLSALPDSEPFPTKVAIEIGAALGIAERTVGKYLGMLCAIGKLQQPTYGKYCKI